MDYLQNLLVICPLIFFAGFMDAIVGGGGIISVPAYYFIGMPPHMVLGTNKFASTFGTTIAAYRFLKFKLVHIKAAVVSVVAALIGSASGARIALLLNQDILRYVLLVTLPLMAVVTFTNKNFLSDRNIRELPLDRILTLSGIIGFVVGAYDGFFGPGAGTFLIIAFNTLAGFSLIQSAANGKMVNWASNVAAFIIFLRSGNVMLIYGVPAAICSIAGNYLGSTVALKNGAKIIRPLFLLVFILLLLKILYDILM